MARLTGIRNDDLEGAPTFSDIAERLAGLLDGRVFVAHDIRFDLPFLRWEFARRGIAHPAVTGLCTLQLSRQLWPDLASRSLPDLARRFNISHDNPHRAAADAAATAGVLGEALVARRRTGPGRPRRSLPPRRHHGRPRRSATPSPLASRAAES